MASVDPNESQIALLPKWARVLFATRCARRLEQLLHVHANVSRDFASVVRRAISEAELSAEYGISSDELAEASLLADAAHESAQEDDDILPAMTAATACWVAKAAQFAEEVSASAAHGACSAAQRFGCAADEILRDYQHLLEISVSQNWTERSPAPIETLPPLEPYRNRKDSPLL